MRNQLSQMQEEKGMSLHNSNSTTEDRLQVADEDGRLWLAQPFAAKKAQLLRMHAASLSGKHCPCLSGLCTSHAATVCLWGQAKPTCLMLCLHSCPTKDLPYFAAATGCLRVNISNAFVGWRCCHFLIPTLQSYFALLSWCGA